MARFVDLDDEPDAREAGAWPAARAGHHRAPTHASAAHGGDKSHDDGRSDADSRPRARNAATEAFCCYPIVISVASRIDLNTLDALARTSRGIHDGLIQFRSILRKSTLRCFTEAPSRDALLRFRAGAGKLLDVEYGHSFQAKSRFCARDMVQECRRCAEVVCRNCVIKPPPPVALRERHRRLCVACARAPLATILGLPRETCILSSSEAIQRAVCSCDGQGVWLCQACGRYIRMADDDYWEIWHWRTQYGVMLGGLGTGIGEGDRGFICGREADCLAARDNEVQVDCDAEDARDADTESPPSAHRSLSPIPVPAPSATATATVDHTAPPGAAVPMAPLLFDELRHEHEHAPSPQLGPGYERQEIEGIGGKLKRKLVRMVRVGACVREGADKTGFGGRVLGPEVRGDERSWCGWCRRVIPGHRDMAVIGADQKPAGPRFPVLP